MRPCQMVLAILGCTGLALALDAHLAAQESGPTTSGSSGSGPTSAGKTAVAVTDFQWFKIEPPKEWVAKPVPASGVRKAQYELPAADKTGAAAEFTVYFFGKGQGGSPEANLERWHQQFRKPDGMKDSEFSQTSKQVVDDMKVTILEVRGEYLGNVVPGVPESAAQKDHVMFAAIIETSGGNYFFKCLGPRPTMQHWKRAWYAMTLGLKALKKE